MDPGASVGQFLSALHQRRRQNRINHLQYLVTVRSIEHDVAFVLCAHRALGNGHRCSPTCAAVCGMCRRSAHRAAVTSNRPTATWVAGVSRCLGSTSRSAPGSTCSCSRRRRCAGRLDPRALRRAGKATGGCGGAGSEDGMQRTERYDTGRLGGSPQQIADPGERTRPAREPVERERSAVAMPLPIWARGYRGG